MHAQQKGHTYSANKAVEAAWIKSELGAQWAAERKKLIAADEHESDSGSMGGDRVDPSTSSDSSSSSSSTSSSSR